MSLTVKAFLHRRSWKEEPLEIRRFALDQDVSTSYSYLVQKLAQVFPSVPAEDIVLSWADADGDYVTISSDEELLEALDQFDGSIFKIHLKRKEKLRAVTCGQPIFCAPPFCPSQQSASQKEEGGDEQMEGEGGASEQPPGSGADPQRQQKEGPEHVGVVCDGCSSGIFGIRYKCLVCPDYDLCSSCEKQGKHVDHNMVTIKDPYSFNPWGFSGGRQFGGPFRGRGRYHCRGGRGRPGPQWLSPYFLQHFLGQWSQGGHSCQSPSQEKPTQGKTEEMETEQQQPKRSESAPTTDDDAQLEKEQRQSYLQDIGEAVSTFLRPFGVKVDVGVVDGDPPKRDDSTASSSKVPSGYDGNTLYPTLDPVTADQPSTGEAPTPATAGAEADSVEAVVSQLRGMGFDNDGGWLTELVRAKGGDIEKVLDALHHSQSD